MAADETGAVGDGFHGEGPPAHGSVAPGRGCEVVEEVGAGGDGIVGDVGGGVGHMLAVGQRGVVELGAAAPTFGGGIVS